MTENTAQGASTPSEKQLRVRELVKNLDAHIDAVWATSVVIGSGVAAGLVEKDRREALYMALANLRHKGLIEPAGDLPMVHRLPLAQAMQGRKKTVTA